MSFANCIEAVERAAGRKLGDDEMESLFTALERRRKYLEATGVVADTEEAALRAADDIARDLELAAVIERRNAGINWTRRVERTAWLMNTFGKNVAEGLEAMLVGVNRAKQGARAGVAQTQERLVKQYMAGFTHDLEATGHLPLFSSGAMDREVSRALWSLGQQDAKRVPTRAEADAIAALPREAVDIAKVIQKWQELARLDANRAGAAIGKEPGYITRQSHDPEKIRGNGSTAAMDAWAQVALDTFDMDAMLAERLDGDPAAMLRDLWTNLSSGNHMKAVPEPTGFKGPGNIAKKLSQGRVIRFKDADAWFRYNETFGTGNLRESVISGLRHNGEATGLMQVLGTNPQAMFEAIKGDAIQQLKDAGDVEQVAKIQQKTNRLDMFMSAVDGSMNIAGNAMWARRAANVRSWESLSKLGGMLLSQLNDVAVYASGARYQGRGFFAGMTEAVSGLGRGLKATETRDLAASLGVVLDNMAGELGRIGTFAEGGNLARVTQIFMKLNGSTWWTNRMRTSAAFGMSHHMALQSEKGWSALGEDFQRVLSLYGIGEAEWKVIQKTGAKHVDGRSYIVPEALRTVDDEHVRGYVGQAASDAEKAHARTDIEDKLRNYFVDQTSILALEPDAKVRATTLQGTRAGTWTGELMRFVMQFKSFTGAYMQRILGRELFGRGYEGDSIIGALRHGNGEFTGLAQLVVTSTLMGYASMALKDLAKGRTPRDPTQSPADAAKIFLAAMVQGGGAGIYGDFLFGQASRMGSGMIEQAAGPTISSAGRFVDLYHKAIAGDDVAARALNEVLNNTPFLNLFYTRAALNYLIFYRLQESMNPGYLRRMEADVEKNNAQGFLLRPSEVVR
jgi:hypothetical protein